MNRIPKLPADFNADEENAWTLPAPYYTQDAVFQYEQEKIFAHSWICVAHRSELAEPNDYVTRDIIGESIIVLRDRDGILRAFYNVCPHRGHQLLQGSGKAKNVITCPYHAWTFKLDGELAFARNCDNVPNFDRDKATLVPIKVEEAAGFVFINLNPRAGSVEDQLPGFEARLRAACPVVDPGNWPRASSPKPPPIGSPSSTTTWSAITAARCTPALRTLSRSTNTPTRCTATGRCNSAWRNRPKNPSRSMPR